MKAFAVTLCTLVVLSNAAMADTNELRIAKQPGLSYLPAVIAEKLQLVEKHARAAGVELVKTDRKRAAEIYLEVNKESITREELTEILDEPSMVFSAAPLGLLQAAQFFSRAGYIKQNPSDWREFFFPEVHDLNGS